MSILSTKEIHQIAMNLVGSQLEGAGYEFLGVNSKPGVDPQFVCTFKKELHFIVVRGFLYPSDPLSPDRAVAWLRRVSGAAHRRRGALQSSEARGATRWLRDTASRRLLSSVCSASRHPAAGGHLAGARVGMSRYAKPLR